MLPDISINEKHRIIYICLALIFTQISSATTVLSCDSVPYGKKHTYDAWLHSSSPKATLFGNLRGVSDSIVFLETERKYDAWNKYQGWLVVPVSNIESISFRRKNSYGIGIGIVLGLAGLGAMAGIKTAKHPETESAPVLLVRILGGFTVGTLLGAAIGFKKKKIILKGEQKRLVKNRAKLQQYVK